MSDQAHNILDVLTQMELLQTEQAEECARLKARIQSLEESSRKLYEVISHDNNDHESRRRLTKTEEQLHDTRRRLQKLDTELKGDLRRIRQQVFDLRNDELATLEDEMRQLRQRRTEIQKQLLPEALSRVDALHEEESELDKHLAELSSRSEELNRLDLENVNKVA